LVRAQAEGLTYLQDAKVSEPTRDYLARVVQEFRAREATLPPDPRRTLDTALAEYFDHLFFLGYNHEKGDKVMAGLAHFSPQLRRTHKGSNYPQASAALAGFRLRAHGVSRDPLPRPVVFAIIGEMVAAGHRMEALGTFIGWDAFLRLPSDLISMTGASLIPPVKRSGITSWGLLLYPHEQERRSKVGGHDESMLLLAPEFTGLARLLRQLKADAGPTGRLWKFTGSGYGLVFNEALEKLGLSIVISPYQVRHGAASEAALRNHLSLSAIQERLRHSSPASTRRYEKHTRYLAELGKVSPGIVAYADWVEGNLVGLLMGSKPPVSFRHR